MKLSFAFLISISVCFYACTFDASINETTTSFSSTINRGNGIDEAIRKEIAEKNAIVFNAIYNDSPGDLNPIMSDLFKAADPENFETTIHQIHSLIDSTDHVIFEEFHSKSSVAAQETEIASNTKQEKDTNDYVITYTSASEEAYLSLLMYSYGTCNMMLTTLYGKYGGEWQLDLLHVSNYAAYGGNAPMFYYDSKSYFDKGQLLQAYTRMLLSQLCSKPAGDIFAFELQTEMEAYYKEVSAKVEDTYTFPIILEEIKTKPELVGITLSATSDYAFFPLISYQSTIPLEDTQKLEQEADQILTQLESVLPGFTTGFSHVFLKAYNELPAENKAVPKHTFLKEVVVRS